MAKVHGNVRRFETATNQPLDAKSIESLEEILTAVKEGRVTAFAIVAREAGYARWSSWRARLRSDRYNILGQLTALTIEIVNDTERE